MLYVISFKTGKYFIGAFNNKEKALKHAADIKNKVSTKLNILKVEINNVIPIIQPEKENTNISYH